MIKVDIISIIKLQGGLLESVDSFIIPAGDKRQEKVSKAEENFKEKILELDDSLDEEDLEAFIEDGYYDDGCGNELRFTWSDSVG